MVGRGVTSSVGSYTGSLLMLTGILLIGGGGVP